MTYKSALKLIEAIRANQVYVTDEVIYSAADRIYTLIKERDAEKARADRLEALLRETQADTPIVRAYQKVIAKLKGEQQ